MSFEEKGYLTLDELDSKIPNNDRHKKGPVAIIECIQKIPCNPWQFACTRKAIKDFKEINDIPDIDFDLCNGCGICIAQCPGLAIFVVWQDYNELESLVKIPFEFLPVPIEGNEYALLDRSGKVIGKGKVIKIQTNKNNPKTKILWITTPKELCMDTRGIKVVDNE